MQTAGWVDVSNRPGLGIEIDQPAIEKLKRSKFGLAKLLRRKLTIYGAPGRVAPRQW
jgi:hypothetical protein